jgi:hypothetical protein
MLRNFEKRTLKVVGPKGVDLTGGENQFRNGQFHSVLHSSLNNVKVTQKERMQWSVHEDTWQILSRVEPPAGYA